MKIVITLILLTLIALTPATAKPPTTTVDIEQQATRDHEKLNILRNESNEQRQIAAQLQQQRAIDLANGNQEELAKTEARLEEVSGNITQIQQEINLAQGQPAAIKPVTVRLNPQQGAEATTRAQKAQADSGGTYITTKSTTKPAIRTYIIKAYDQKTDLTRSR